MEPLLMTAAVLLALFLMGVYRSTGRPVRTAAKSMGLGAVGLLLVQAASVWTGLTLGINAFTVGCSLLLGLPGVVGMLLLRTLWR